VADDARAGARPWGSVAYAPVRLEGGDGALAARRGVFDCIEMFYNPKRRQGYNQGLAPVEFEKQHFQLARMCLLKMGWLNSVQNTTPCVLHWLG
jgi:hypothetical protein